MFQIGFISSKAPLFMDLSTIYYFFLPFLLFYSIRYAIKKEYKKHIISQGIIFVLSMIILILFEIGIRINGGFIDLIAESQLPYKPMMSFLVFHIIVAFSSTCCWCYLIVSSYNSYKKNNLIKHHVMLGRFTFVGITATCFMGIVIYYLLFIF